MMDGTAQQKTADYEKIRFYSRQAAKDGLQYFGVDTYCIDRSSSQEVQEAITVIYQWYRKATPCYAYLSDVTVTEDEVDNNDPVSSQPWEAAFHNSRWFTRG